MLIRVTRFAILLQVFACQPVSRGVVIKCVLIKTDDIEVAAVMLTMAGKPVFTGYFGGGVKTLPLIDAGFDFFMAIETFRIGYFIAKVMTFGAIHNAFEMGVVTRQITG